MVIDIREAYFLSLKVTLLDALFRSFIQVPSKMFPQILAEYRMDPVKTLVRFQVPSLLLFSSIFFFNKPKSPTLLATLTFWIYYKSFAFTKWA
jgi:hypothetical protein